MGNIIEVPQFKRKEDTKKGLRAIRTIRDICSSQYQEDCNAGRCPLSNWCHKDRKDYPYNWFC